MNSIDQKLASTYWLNKIKKAFPVNESSLEEQKKIKKIIAKEEFVYFSKLTNNNEIVEYTVLISVFNALLCRYFDINGFIYSSKTGEDTIPLLFTIRSIKEKTFKQYLQDIKKEVQEVYSHLDYEQKLQEKFAFEKYANYGLLYNQANPSSKVPFTLSIKKIEGNLELEILYNDTFVSDCVSNHFLETFKNWLSNLEEHVNEDIEQIPIITQPEQQQLLEGFNNTDVDYPEDKTIVDLFEQQVDRTPDALAVVFKEKELTYRILNEIANQLAAYLQKHYTIQSDNLVAIKLDRSENLIIAILGVLKAGGAYVPIDINYPEQRIEYIEKDSNAKVVIDSSFLEEFERAKANYSKENITSKVTTNHLAYVIYTSGTTGNPKGVMVEHKSVLNQILWYTDTFDINEETNSLLLTSYTFDPSTQDIFGTLIKGGKLHLISSDEINDLDFLYRFVKSKQITILNYIPNFIDNLLSKAPKIDSIKSIIVGGESLSSQAKNNLINKGYKLFNNYGPTETTVDVLSGLMSDRNVHIGRPISNTHVYILDANLELLPIGVSGKLYISGDGLARGYLNRPELTKEKFIANPFIEGSRMYDTGDLAKWLPDGNIEFLGRKDHQIKLRGYRIELGEIENTVLSYSKNIHQAVALVKNETLVVYYTREDAVDETALNGYLKERLPSYMLPNHLKALESIPLTPSGKIDRKQLENLSIDYSANVNYVAPRNEIEQKLVEIWQEVLGIEKVGIQDNFFELGGHSLLVGQVINQIYKHLEGSLTYKEFFQDPIIERIAKAITRENYSPIPQVEKQAYYPLTPSQHRIWVLSQLEGGSQAYNMSGAVSLQGALDLDKLKKAFSELIARHEVLRTCFKPNEEGEVHQYITDVGELSFDITLHNFEGKSKEEIDTYIRKEQLISFDLTKVPLLRVSLLQTNKEEHLLSFTIHHIIGDGWSMELLISEIVTTYNKLLESSDYKSEPLSIQYKDYSVWLQSQLTSESYKDSEVYWLDKFQGELPILSLPSFKKRPLIQTYNGKTISHQFSKEFLSKLKRFSKKHDATLFITLMSGINALLYRYTNQDEIIIGTPIAGREHPNLEQQIGLYLNTLAIRTQLKDDFGFEDLLQQQKQILLEAYEYQIYPFDALVSRLDLKRDTSRSALFDVMVVLQNQNQVTSISSSNQNLEGIQINPYELERKTSQVDVSFAFAEENEGLYLEIEYNTDIYDDFLITRMFDHFESLLNQAIDNPKEQLLSIDYLTEEESKQILEEFNNTIVDYPKDKTIVDLFEEQVEKTPNNVAVVFEDKELTYQELNERANQLTGYLQKNYKIQSDDLIAIKLDRSEYLLVAILGILKTGAAYVPIDTNYPQQRIEYIEKDSDAKVVIDRSFLEGFKKSSTEFSKSNVTSKVIPDHLAYVIYTSGTTGNPKGVMVTHRNVVSIYSDWKNQYQLDTFKINLLQLASVSFDVFVGDICRSLLNGGTMIIPSDDNKLDTEALYKLIEEHQISIFEGTPALLLPLLDYIKTNNKDHSFLRLIIFGSDSFNNTTFNEIKDYFESSDIKIINSYGVTEATIDSTFYSNYNSELQGTTPIGKPFSNTKIYILNDNKKPVPVGVFGELLIGGVGVSRGYYKRPKLTQSKFISIDQSKGKVYATGDIARWLPDGNIEFLGRNDNQVKIRGYRIELGEIESALNEFSEDIKQTVVSVKDINDEKTLVAYYTSLITPEKKELKSFLLEKLPDYMVPSFFIQLETIPLTPNGKIDKNSLPDISEKDIIKKPFTAPKNEIEAKLILIWKELLEIETIGTNDDFFELGGHSLKITKLRNHIARAFDVTISFNDLFLKTTIVEQGVLIAKSSLEKFEYIPKTTVQDYYPLSSSQRRIWLLSQFEGSSNAYNMPGIFEISGTIKTAILQKAFEILIERHEVLRTRFIQNLHGEVKQQILTSSENNFEFIYKQLNNCSGKQIKDAIKKEIDYEFDLEKECLLKASLYQIKEKQFVLTVIIHHIISDGWSIDLFTNELFALYNAYNKNIKNPLQPLSIHYKDFAVWELEQLQESTNNQSKTYWLKQFSNEIPVLELPYKQKRPLHKTYRGKFKTISISHETALKFKHFCKKNDSTLFMGLLTIVKVLLYRYTNQKDIIIGTPIAGREHIQLQNQLGVYINTLALRARFDGKHNFKEVLYKVKSAAKEAYENQSYPFDKLVEDLNLPRNLSRNPLFDIMVTLQNTGQEDKELNSIEGIVIREMQITDEIACKFDMDFVFEEIGEQINLSLIYNTALFGDDFISDFSEQFELLIKNSIEVPELPIYELQILTHKQQETLLEIGTGTRDVILDSNKTFINFFKDWVIKTPNSVAIRDNESQLTYDELDKRSNAVAAHLNKAVSDQEATIGVVLSRSINTIMILLGVLKSGKAYIPLDPTFPLERLKYIVSHSKMKTLICDNQFSFLDTKDITILNTETVLSDSIVNEVISDSIKLPKSKDTAYIIYTSGSTGNPKGVEIGHSSLMNFLLSIKEKLEIQPKDLLYAVTTYSFDISILEFFVPLVSGASVFIANNETLIDAQKIIKDIETIEPTIIQATPSFYQLLFNAGWTGGKKIKMLCGGDSLSETLASQLLSSSKELWNMYGPTETTIWSSIKHIEQPEEASNIGSAIDNTSLYVLGENKELLPKGAQGILHIGGDGLAKGYYKDKNLTTQRFIKKPYEKGLLYETGDIVKWNIENELVFFGRNDHQVKVRGYRIELGDVEAKLNGIEEISQAIVIVKKDTLEEAVLVAFYSSSHILKTADIKKRLREALPDYMIPLQFIRLDKFPLTPNKKIDRKALFQIDFNKDVQKEYKEPTTEIEKKLLTLWKEFFELEKISIDDHFFDLGGHSLTATKLVSRIQEEFSIQLSINKVFEYVTIEQQAEYIENLKLVGNISKEEDFETEFENFTI